MKENKINSSTIIIVILSFLLILTTGYIVYENLKIQSNKDSDIQLQNPENDQETNVPEDESGNQDDENLSLEAKKLKSLFNKLNNEASIQKVVFTSSDEVNGTPVLKEKEITENLKTLISEITSKIFNNSIIESLPEGIGFAGSDSISVHYTDSNNQTRELVILKSSNNIAIFDYRNKYNGELDNSFYVKLNTSLFDYMEQKYFD